MDLTTTEKGGLKMPKVYGYARVSHIDSVERGISLGTQEEAAKTKYQQMKVLEPDLQWERIFVDPAVSAYRHKFAMRPQGAILNQILEKGDVVIFARLDRAFRSVGDCFRTIEAWEARGIRIVFCDQNWDTGTACGKFLVAIFAALAEFQSAMMSERIKEGFARKKRLGGSNSEIHTGRKKVKSRTLQTTITILDPAQREVALKAAEISRENPTFGYHRIACKLEAWLAEKEGRKPRVESMQKYPRRTIRSLLSVAEEWEELQRKEQNEKNPGTPDGGIA